MAELRAEVPMKPVLLNRFIDKGMTRGPTVTPPRLFWSDKARRCQMYIWYMIIVTLHAYISRYTYLSSCLHIDIHSMHSFTRMIYMSIYCIVVHGPFPHVPSHTLPHGMAPIQNHCQQHHHYQGDIVHTTESIMSIISFQPWGLHISSH